MAFCLGTAATAGDKNIRFFFGRTPGLDNKYRVSQHTCGHVSICALLFVWTGGLTSLVKVTVDAWDTENCPIPPYNTCPVQISKNLFARHFLVEPVLLFMNHDMDLFAKTGEAPKPSSSAVCTANCQAQCRHQRFRRVVFLAFHLTRLAVIICRSWSP